MSKNRITFSEITENNIATRLENTLKLFEPHSKIQKQLDSIVPSSIREIIKQQNRLRELSGTSLFAKIPSIEKSILSIDWSKLNQTTSAFENIFKVKRELERHLTPEERERLKQEAKAAQERLRAMASEPEKVEEVLQEVENNAEIMQAVLCVDEKAISTFSQAQIKQALIWIFNLLGFISILSTITGYTFKDLIELFQPSSQEIICREYHIENGENAEIRKVRLNKGTLNVRQYPNEKGKILAELPNGELICLLNKPKGNQRWLKVNIKDNNDNIITGYVNARFTEKITFINGEKL